MEASFAGCEKRNNEVAGRFGNNVRVGCGIRLFVRVLRVLHATDLIWMDGIRGHAQTIQWRVTRCCKASTIRIDDSAVGRCIVNINRQRKQLKLVIVAWNQSTWQ